MSLRPRALMFRYCGPGKDDDPARVQFIFPESRYINLRIESGWILIIDEQDIRDQAIEDARRQDTQE